MSDQQRIAGFEELYEKLRQAMFDRQDYFKTTQYIELIARQLRERELADVWWIGESYEFDLSALIVGAYWHYTEWHCGQGSLEYRTLSALGQIFQPGMTTGPEEGSGEMYAYEALEHLAKRDQLDRIPGGWDSADFETRAGGAP